MSAARFRFAVLPILAGLRLGLVALPATAQEPGEEAATPPVPPVGAGDLTGGEVAEAATRRAQVAERGARVMPFDLDRTRHDFRLLEDGGLQTVVAREPSDRAQVELIREHLSRAAARFNHGDFSDPALIHGEEMPGLAELRERTHRIRIEYGLLPDGAQIRYSASEAALVEALHRWFQAQTSHHGPHARP
jgi:hypothetical protein